ncbi:hypothetical protein J7E88_07245 [Streptomyces sp. ISL-10]|uniref:hypothetical protein n=1 Tax=Streptomyces sp. ISL-10 TaxID=2819172 RepID=UPI001BE55272|nr:hypothetical protein [Streptomyces sp. ISL-10]MBT2365119.1 hypothetical protein [Streptomyces sp. ISL-10]
MRPIVRPPTAGVDRLWTAHRPYASDGGIATEALVPEWTGGVWTSIAVVVTTLLNPRGVRERAPRRR